MDENSSILAVYRLCQIINDPEHIKEAVELGAMLLRYNNLAKLVTRHHGENCSIRLFVENKGLCTTCLTHENLVFLLSVLEHNPSDKLYYVVMILDFKKKWPQYLDKYDDNLLLTCNKEDALTIIRNNKNLGYDHLFAMIKRLDLTDTWYVVKHVIDRRFYDKKEFLQYLIDVTFKKYRDNLIDSCFYYHVYRKQPKSIIIIDADPKILERLACSDVTLICSLYNKVHPQTCYRFLKHYYDNENFRIYDLQTIAKDLKFVDKEDRPHEGTRYPYVPGSNHSRLIRDFLKNKINGRKLIIGRNNWLKRK